MSNNPPFCSPQKGILVILAIIFSIGLVNHFRSVMIQPPNDNSFEIGEFLEQSALGAQIDTLPDVWQSRIVSRWISGKFFDLINPGRPYSQSRVINTYGAYYAGWFFLTFIALIFLSPSIMGYSTSLVAMLGIMAGIMVNTIPLPHPLIYPWDGPSMFFFTLSFLLYLRKLYWPMAVVVLFGVMIKETNLVFCLLFFFNKNWSWPRRVAAFAIAMGAGLMLMHLFTPKNNHGTSLEQSAIRMISHLSIGRILNLWPIILANAGALILLPYSVIKTGCYALGLVFLAFFAGQCLDYIGSGATDEYRNWYELLPISWLLFALAFNRHPETENQMASGGLTT